MKRGGKRQERKREDQKGQLPSPWPPCNLALAVDTLQCLCCCVSHSLAWFCFQPVCGIPGACGCWELGLGYRSLSTPIPSEMSSGTPLRPSDFWSGCCLQMPDGYWEPGLLWRLLASDLLGHHQPLLPGPISGGAKDLRPSLLLTLPECGGRWFFAWPLILWICPSSPPHPSATLCINTYPCIKQDIPLISSSS